MANMGVPEKKISPYFYAAVIGCIVAMPIVMLLGYLLDLSSGDEGQIQIFELLTNSEEYLSEANVGGFFTALLHGGMTAKATIIGFFASLIVIMYVLMGDGKRYHRKGSEHGSARWGSKAEKDIIADTNDFYNNVICASDIMLVLDRKKRDKNEAQAGKKKADKKEKSPKQDKKSETVSHDTNIKVSVKDIVSQSKEAAKIKPMLNLNQMILGGSGTGKSRFFVKPNLLMCNTSYIVTDPSGELVQACGQMLINHGYKIKVFNLNDMKHSSNYNPFHYLRDYNGDINANNVIKMINVFMMNTKAEGASGGDPFWDDATRLLLSALSFLLIETGTEEEQNFSGVLDLIHKAKVIEGKEEEKSELDLIFDQRKEADPKALSVQYYDEFKQAAGKTMQSILISTTTKLQYFKLPDVRNLTCTDNIHLEEVGDEYTALFIVIPSSDTTYNFLAAMMYTQLFDTLYDRAINMYKGRLPVHVRFMLDEFANIGKIPEIDKILATCRKFEISIQIILQNLSQLKKMYKEGWEKFGGNCDTMIYLGGKDQFTNEYISKELGKETIDQQSINQTKGKQGSSSYNNAILGRELATLDELSAMDNNDCIVMVRGLPPFFTHKFDISNHPRYAELGERWKPAEGQTELDNPYIYILEDKMFTVPETEYIELTDFISTGDADETNMVEVRCVFSDEEPTITEEEIMADVPYEIRKKFKGCTELFTAA